LLLKFLLRTTLSAISFKKLKEELLVTSGFVNMATYFISGVNYRGLKPLSVGALRD
jgi:hypothetical protein